jgi:hypothetical protein
MRVQAPGPQLVRRSARTPPRRTSRLKLGDATSKSRTESQGRAVLPVIAGHGGAPDAPGTDPTAFAQWGGPGRSRLEAIGAQGVMHGYIPPGRERRAPAGESVVAGEPSINPMRQYRLMGLARVLAIAGVLGVPSVLIASCGSPGLPAVTAVPRSIPHGGIALWQDNDEGTLTGLEAYLHPPASPGLDMTQAEARARAQGYNPVTVRGATLASLTFPSGIQVGGHQVPAKDAWIVTLAYPHREHLFCVGGFVVTGTTTSTTVPPTGCGMWVSKYIVAVDALAGSVQSLIETN